MNGPAFVNTPLCDFFTCNFQEALFEAILPDIKKEDNDIISQLHLQFLNRINIAGNATLLLITAPLYIDVLINEKAQAIQPGLIFFPPHPAIPAIPAGVFHALLTFPEIADIFISEPWLKDAG